MMGFLNYVELAIAKLSPQASDPGKNQAWKNRLLLVQHLLLSTDPRSKLRAILGQAGACCVTIKRRHGRSSRISAGLQLPVKEYLLVSEDPDIPLFSKPATHGIYYQIPSTKTSVEPKDFNATENGKSNMMAGGFRYGKILRSAIYHAPRPLLNHGPHRYVYTVVGLKEPVDARKLSTAPSKDELSKAIEGKVLGYGVWIGSYERKWQ